MDDSRTASLRQWARTLQHMQVEAEREGHTFLGYLLGMARTHIEAHLLSLEGAPPS